jgi:hypothetical protein
MSAAFALLIGLACCGSNSTSDPFDGGAGADGSVGVDGAAGADGSVGVDSGAGADGSVGVDSGAGTDGGAGVDAQVTEPLWANTHIDYSGAGVAESVDLTNCYYCDASDASTHTLIRYQQGGGYTIWALYIPNGATTGTHTLSTDYSGFYATLSANDAALPAAARGFYFGNVNVGSVTLTSVDLSQGGSVDGSIDVSWTKDGVTAHLVATFHADLP